VSQNDLGWYLFFRRHRRTVRRVSVLVFIGLFLAGLIYAVLISKIILERIY
jgi:hypothetical protein